MVEDVKDAPAFYSGFKMGDRISMYTVASHDSIEPSQLIQLKKLAAVLSEIKKAHTDKKSVIFVVQRPAVTWL